MAQKPTAPDIRVFRLGAPAAHGAVAQPPIWFSREYKGHGHTYHTWDAPPFSLAQLPTADMIPNAVGVPLLTAKARLAFESLRAATDVLHWLPVRLLAENEAEAEAYILHLPYRKNILVVRQQHLDAHGALAQQPPISRAALGELRVFTYLNPLPRYHFDVLVTEDVCRGLEAAGLVGLAFEAVETVDADVLSRIRPTQRPAKLVYA